jgi:hypothetical protein
MTIRYECINNFGHSLYIGYILRILNIIKQTFFMVCVNCGPDFK